MAKQDTIRKADCALLIKLALSEDIGVGDITTMSVTPEEATALGQVIAEEPCVVAGLPVAGFVYEELDPEVEFRPRLTDGDRVEAGTVLAEVSGPAQSVLSGERVMLNFLQRLSGIATLVAQYVARVEPYQAKIMDTRKTAPGSRVLEKYAVRVGGGKNHRMGLFDQFLIKDNHLRASGLPKADRIKALVAAARGYNPNIQVEVEAETLEEVSGALAAGADIIMLDNMSVEEIKQAVEVVAEKAVVEASGGVTLDTVEAIAATGVDCISVGGLTTAARAINIKLDLVE